MGLAEKRWALERKKNDEASFVSQLKGVTGSEIAVEIDWDGFSGALDDVQYITHDSYGLPNLIKALKEVCVDDLGKDAVKAGLTKVVIAPAKADNAKFSFDGGVITWKAYFGSSSTGYVYADAMKKAIEAAL